MTMWDRFVTVIRCMNLAFACALALGYLEVTPFWNTWLHIVLWPMAVLAIVGGGMLIADVIGGHVDAKEPGERS